MGLVSPSAAQKLLPLRRASFSGAAGARGQEKPDAVAGEWICKTGLITFTVSVLPLPEETHKKRVLRFYVCGFEKNRVWHFLGFLRTSPSHLAPLAPGVGADCSGQTQPSCVLRKPPAEVGASLQDGNTPV